MSDENWQNPVIAESLADSVKMHLKLEGELADQRRRLAELQLTVSAQNMQRITDMLEFTEGTLARLENSRDYLVRVHQSFDLPIPDELIRSYQ